MKTFYLLIFLLLFSSKTFSQSNSKIWYFGIGVGLDFNSSPPNVLGDSKILQMEGCGTVSDSLGNLLFYTDGRTIWNRDHQIIPGGENLLGHFSASQTGVIVQKPFSCDIFYVFTTPSWTDNNGFNFTVIDLSRDGGKGAVIDTLKNINLMSKSCEMLTLATHDNGKDIWIIAHEILTNKFHSYLLSSNGLSLTPVISAIGQPIGTTESDNLNTIKASASGEKIAVAYRNYLSNEIVLFDFDNKSGVLSNDTVLIKSGSPYDIRGISHLEFSQSERFLYVGCAFPLNHECDNRVYQIDLENSTPFENVFIFHDKIVENSSTKTAGLQRGIDGKIYINRVDNFLGVIHEPDSLGPKANLDFNAINFSEFVSFYFHGTESGLPQGRYFEGSCLDLNPSNACIGSNVSYGLQNSMIIDSIYWEINDTIFKNNSTIEYTYRTSGNKEVKAILYQGSSIKEFNFYTQVEEYPNLVETEDTTMCPGQTISMTSTNGLALLWENSIIATNYSIEDSGLVRTSLFLDDCIYKDSFQVYLKDTCELAESILLKNSPSFGSNYFTIEVISNLVSKYEILLFNELGQLIERASFENNIVNWMAKKELASGSYFIVILKDGEKIRNYKGIRL